MRAALGWALAHDGPQSLLLSGVLWKFWYLHNHYVEGRTWLAQALAQGGDTDAAERMKALGGAGELAEALGDYADAQTIYRSRLSLARQLGDRRASAQALHQLGFLAYTLENYPEATRLYTESLSIHRQVHNAAGIATVLGNLALMMYVQGEYTQAWAYGQESLKTLGEGGDTGNRSAITAILGVIAGARATWRLPRSISTQGGQACIRNWVTQKGSFPVWSTWLRWRPAWRQNGG